MFARKKGLLVRRQLRARSQGAALRPFCVAGAATSKIRPRGPLPHQIRDGLARTFSTLSACGPDHKVANVGPSGRLMPFQSNYERNERSDDQRDGYEHEHFGQPLPSQLQVYENRMSLA